MRKTVVVLMLLVASTSLAAGFSIDTHGARATGMATAVTAHPRDASALYYNAAALVGPAGWEVQIGASGIVPVLDFTPTGGTPQEMKRVLTVPPHLYAVYRPIDSVAVGVGGYVPYGANVQWHDDFVGRFLATTSKLTTYDIKPTVAWAPLQWLRLGAGLQVVRTTVELERRLDLVLTEGSLALDGGAWGLGFDAGVQLVAPGEMLRLGAVFRSQVALGFEGDADFRDVPPPLDMALRDQRFSADIRLPASLALGAAVSPLTGLTLEFDAWWVKWSSFGQLAVEFEEPALNAALPKNWDDTWSWRLGGEYEVMEGLALRAGYMYDRAPSPAETFSPDLPDADRSTFSVGVGLRIASFSVDAAYQYLALWEKESTLPLLPGTYGGSAHVFGLTLGYSM